MFEMDLDKMRMVGAQGALPVAPDDEITQRLAMLVEGQCQGMGATHAAES